MISQWILPKPKIPLFFCILILLDTVAKGRGKFATQAGVFENMTADLALDGTDRYAYANNENMDNAWWMVDLQLGSGHFLHSVIINSYVELVWSLLTCTAYGILLYVVCCTEEYGRRSQGYRRTPYFSVPPLKSIKRVLYVDLTEVSAEMNKLVSNFSISRHKTYHDLPYTNWVHMKQPIMY